ncbi:MAG: FkbM family methyltransferase [Rhizomicrobium sp.]
MRAYYHGPDHPAKLRIYYWLRSTPPFRTVTAETPHGVMILDLRDYIQHEIFLHGVYEPATLRLFVELIGEGDCVVDVGANVGQFALAAAARVGASGSVLAIEPHPLNCEQLLANRRASAYRDRIEVVFGAASDHRQMIDFGIPPPSARAICRARPDSTTEGFWAPALQIPDILKQLKRDRVKAIKIDVEGAERGVLKGFLDAGMRPENIIFEYAPGQFDYDEGAGSLIRFVEGFGYRCFDVEGAPFGNKEKLPESNVWARFCRGRD